jgi:DNA-binding transcriptional LysR family regulator
MPKLDVDQLRAFTVAADLRSFTAAGVCVGATQSAVSLRIAKLEDSVGRRLMARTPRSVGLTPDGALFLPHARAILAAHDRALAELEGTDGRSTVRLAVSDHAIGSSLTVALASLAASLPTVAPEVTVGSSAAMRDLYDRGEADAAIVRREGARRDGTPLFTDPLVWAKAPALTWRPGESVPLVALHGACSVKAVCTRALDAAGLSWRYAFLGGSVLALQAAVEARLGIAALGARQVPAGCVPCDGDLPALPASDVVLLTRLDGTTRRVLAAAFEAAGERR